MTTKQQVAIELLQPVISAVHCARFLAGYCTGHLRLLLAEKKVK